jgi:hypothetical protein
VFVAVDAQAGITGKFTATTLAAGLYANNVLNVGNNAITLPNTVAQFALKGESYVQTNFINTSDGGTADHVITANTGTDSTYFVDLGFANKNYVPGSEFNNIGTAIEPMSGYLYVQGNTNGAVGGNLIVGTTSSNTETRLIAGGGTAANVIAKVTQSGLKLVNGKTLTFDDGTVQNTAAATITYTSGVNTTQNTNIQSAWTKANNALANTSGTFDGDLNVAGTMNVNNVLTVTTSPPASSPSITTITTQNYNLSLQAVSNTWTFVANGTLLFPDNTIQRTAFTGSAIDQTARNAANSAVQNTAVIQLNTVQLSGNLIANSPNQGIFVDKFSSNSATFSRDVVVLGSLTANTLLGNIFFSNVVTTTSQSNSILWFPQGGSVTQQTAQLWYYSNTQSLILDTDIPGDRLSISKVLFFRAYNSTGATIPANSFVRLVTGVTANQIPYIALADATSSVNATVAGFVKNAIANDAYGFTYSQGIVEDFNTTGLGQNGDILFLSTTPGLASNTAPTSGNSNTVVQLGKVILSDATQGKLFVQNQLRQAYGRTNGSVLYAFANNIVSSNTISINDSIGVVNANTIIANTVVFGSATANTMVTQLSSKSTAVTANGISGQITMNNAALAGQGYVMFTVNNSYVQHVNDIPFVAVQNGVTSPNPYIVSVGKVAVGSFNITVYNADSGGGSSHSDAIVLNWGLMRVGN